MHHTSLCFHTSFCPSLVDFTVSLSTASTVSFFVPSSNFTQFYSLVKFCNPSALPSSDQFRKVFALPIEKSRDLKCPQEQKKIGQERAKELHKLTSAFMLRRTQEVLENYLPAKHDIVLFCAPTKLQTELYKAYLTCEDVSCICFFVMR